MRNVLLTFSLLLFAGMSFGQIKVVTNGNTGIGTSTPVSALTVEGDGISLSNPGQNKNIIGGVNDSQRLTMSSNYASTSASSAFFTMFGDETHGASGANTARAGELGIGCSYFQIKTGKTIGTFGTLHWQLDAAGTVTNPFGGTATNSFRIIADADKLAKSAGDFKYGLNEVLQMEPKQFTTEIAGKSASVDGVAVMAQDMAKIAPELVSSVEYNDYDNNVNEKLETVDMTAVTFMLVNSIKEQQELIEAQNERIAEMEATIINLANGTTTQAVEVKDSRLGQNAPNPFNQSTVINYTVPTKSNTAVLQIFDLNGQVLKTVNVANGNGQLTINAGELSAGTYSYNLVVDGAIVDTKKMVLTK